MSTRVVAFSDDLVGAYVRVGHGTRVCVHDAVAVVLLGVATVRPKARVNGRQTSQRAQARGLVGGWSSSIRLAGPAGGARRLVTPYSVRPSCGGLSVGLFGSVGGGAACAAALWACGRLRTRREPCVAKPSACGDGFGAERERALSMSECVCA